MVECSQRRAFAFKTVTSNKSYMSLCWIPLLSEMHTLTVLVILLQALGLAWPASIKPPLGMTVHVVPLDSTQGQTVRAHFAAIVSGKSCTVTGLCDTGEDCVVENNTVPFTGSKPSSGWCAVHWQTTLPANFTGNISLGSSTQMYVALKADPMVRANSGKLNHPGFVALLPPLRARKNCPHHFHLSVRDLDGDKVHCRFAKEDRGECLNCTPHSFLELDQENCMLSFTGDASAGEYYIYLMAEDLVPAPLTVQTTPSQPMSAVPFILSLTVEQGNHSCSAEPVASANNPEENSLFYILPFHEKSFTANYDSNDESVTEIAVIGPPQLYRTEFLSVGPISSLNIAWVRSENKLARLLPICFVANTQNLQSEPRCVWLYQREMIALPTGTVLTCEKTEMSLVLPIGSFSKINISELQLNSPSCPVTYNDTHLTARIPLEGCGTKAVHTAGELIYTNTLQTVRTYNKVIRRQPILVLPLACRIPSVLAKGPNYKIGIPKEQEVFGTVEFKLEFYFPGQGPLGKFTSSPVFRYDNQRVRRELRAESTSATTSSANNTSSSSSSVTSAPEASNTTISSSSNSTATNTSSVTSASNSSAAAATTTSQIGSKIDTLDLYVTSNCSIARAEILVSSCSESETEDFAVSHPLLDQGCTASAGALEVVTSSTGTKIYRLDLSDLKSTGSTMYVECTVNLCITTMPSAKCPDLCKTKLTRSAMINNVFSSSYTIKSPAVSLVVTRAPPITNATIPQTTTTTTTTAAPTTSHAPEKAPSLAVGVIVALVCVICQPFL
ncbi:uncharacterized protein LOC117393841 [Periophthalmus magnuspinnatus]|uniref:uncharacterized protein LOC117393841 n=1 Tax=Periophthalmus magnuspinnatus TaxID=409849 RepID=UPI002436E80A|nr:uncharacterized protein LOC117393841 [Periophthalmus magnuspinnatus]